MKAAYKVTGAILAALLIADGAQAAQVVSYAESFSLTSSAVYDQSQMYRPEFDVHWVPGGGGNLAFEGTFVGLGVIPMDRRAFALPGFDSSLGTLQSVSFEMSWTAKTTSGTLAAIPQGTAGFATMSHKADISTALSVDGVGLVSDRVSAESNCFVQTLYSDGRTCQNNASNTHVFSQKMTFSPGVGAPFEITDHPLSIELFNSHLTSWSARVLAVSPEFLTRNVSRLDWNGSISVAYFYAPAVPEPGSWALLILGFGTVGAALRRRAALFKRVALT